MKKNLVLFVFSVVLVTTIGIYLYKSKPSEDTSIESTPAPVEETNILSDLDEKELENYYKVYEHPYVLFLRKALNAYLANDSSGVTIAMVAVTENHREDITSGLDAFDKSYYESRFIVATIDEDEETKYCSHIQLIFQDKPDRIFYAWVCKQDNEYFVLRGFNSKDNIESEDMEAMVEFYKPLLFDKEHSL